MTCTHVEKAFFDILIFHPHTISKKAYQEGLDAVKTPVDDWEYGLVFVATVPETIAAILDNPLIQIVIIFSGCGNQDPLFCPQELSQKIAQLRPEVRRFLVTSPLEKKKYDGDVFHRVLYEPVLFEDVHHHVMEAIRYQWQTPFFHALQHYCQTPKQGFHALPISQATSIKDSAWTQDFLDFYGAPVFDAETSATQGGLDSLLHPTGVIQDAQARAADTFGAKKTFFVTTGTSTANKIVLQATLKPGDIVLVSSDCHKSILYGIMLTGACPIFIETPGYLDYDLSGAVHIERIVEILRDLQSVGKLHLVKQISLTNPTFDGLLVHAADVMRAVYAIKSDIIFHWDEAWFAYGYFNPLYQSRSAMSAISQLKATQSLSVPLRVYVTQSTHKTVTAFRQGSMIHVYDEVFDADIFADAYHTHTSTSPNYQILASLDVGRRQLALEGFGRTQRMLNLAHTLRQEIAQSPVLALYFKVLEASDFGINPQSDLIMLNPTHVTVDIRSTGMEGDVFKALLLSRYAIQVNKTSLSTVLFIFNIGTSHDNVAQLLKALHDIATSLSEIHPSTQPVSSSSACPRITQTRYFSQDFRPFELSTCHVVNLRQAYYQGIDPTQIVHRLLDKSLLNDIQNGKKFVCAGFVTPYPPGYPLLIPGQYLTEDIATYLHIIQHKEIHGYNPQIGLRLFQ